jgi:hypothetical protein
MRHPHEMQIGPKQYIPLLVDCAPLRFLKFGEERIDSPAFSDKRKYQFHRGVASKRPQCFSIELEI